jgi:hypothetical protein
MPDHAIEAQSLPPLTEQIYETFNLDRTEICLPDALNEISRLPDRSAKISRLRELEENHTRWTSAHTARSVEIFDAVKAKITFEGKPLSPEDSEHIHNALSLHDIGKLAVSNKLHNKPGPLDPDEWTEMNKHARVSQFILKAMGFPVEASLVAPHHEHQAHPVGRIINLGNPDGPDRRKPDPKLDFMQKIIAYIDELDSFSNSDDRPYSNGTTEQLKTARLNGRIREKVEELILANPDFSGDSQFMEKVVIPTLEPAIRKALEIGETIRVTPLTVPASCN